MNAFEFARILGGLFYCNDGEELGRRWLEIDETLRKEFFEQLCKEGFGCFLRWRFQKCNVLSDEEIERLRRVGMGNFQRAALDEMAFNELFKILEDEQIRFCPIKGIDLAYRIYPSPSLRPFGDWDILFHPDDIGRVLGSLEKHGWKELLHKDGKGGHHSSPLVKGRYFMEPHWTLSCFTNADPRKIWDYVNPVKGSNFRYTLCPELNLLLIARHASEWNYREVALSKVLLDAAMVIARENVDWGRLRDISKTLNQPYAGNFFAAFSEFFPDEMVERMAAEPEKRDAYREIFAHRKEFLKVKAPEVMLEDKKRFSIGWFKRVLAVYYPRNLRYKYGLPLTGANGTLAWKYVVETASKFTKLLGCLSGKKTPGFKEYLQVIQKAEEIE